MDIPILSIQTYDMSKYEPIEIVNALSIHSISLIRDMFSNVLSLFGGQQHLIEKKYLDLRNEVLQKLYTNAKNIKADMVIGVDYDITTFDGKYMIFSMNGTALRLKKKNNKKNNNKKTIN
jgi:uncharacterized protein YbjQ (UPF0145 family)